MIGYLADAVEPHNCSSIEQVSMLGAKLEVEDTWMSGVSYRSSSAIDQRRSPWWVVRQANNVGPQVGCRPLA